MSEILFEEGLEEEEVFTESIDSSKKQITADIMGLNLAIMRLF